MIFSPNNLGVIVCSHVRDKLRPVVLVTHFENGDWSFTCGESDHDHSEESVEYALVGVVISRSAIPLWTALPISSAGSWANEKPSEVTGGAIRIPAEQTREAR